MADTSAPRNPKVLALRTPNSHNAHLWLITIFNMSPRRSQRAPKPTTIWEENKAPPAALDAKITPATSRTRPETALKPVLAEPLPNTLKIDYGSLPNLPHYLPPLKIRYEACQQIATGLSALQAFLLSFSQAIVDIIC
jgi:hypothetical protein